MSEVPEAIAIEEDTAADPPPDWSQRRADDLRCPMCDYSLFRLTEPRCPECGYRFTWREIVDATENVHPYLYEHHPEANVRSFWRTLRGGLLPSRFWTRLRPSTQARPRRIVRYWTRCAAVAVLLPLLAVWGCYAYAQAEAAIASWSYAARLSRAAAASSPPTFWQALGSAKPWDPEEVYHLFRDNGALAFLFTMEVLWLTWPWLTYLSLMVFAQTMRRVKLRRVHPLRCVVYSADVGVWFGLAIPLTLAADFLLGPGTGTNLTVFLSLALVAGLWAVIRLAFAYSRYMQFDHPMATVVASQLIVALVYLNLLALL